MAAGDRPAGLPTSISVNGLGGLKILLLVAGTGVGEAGDLGSLKRGDELALRGFLVDVFPDGLAVCIQNLKAEVIEAWLQAAVGAVPENNTGKIMHRTEVNFPPWGGVAIAVVVGDALGLKEVSVGIAVDSEPCMSIVSCGALSSTASECHVFIVGIKGLDLGNVENAVFTGKLNTNEAASLVAAAVAL